LQTETSDSGNASLLAAQFAVRRLGPALLHAGSGHSVVTAAAVLTALLALVAGAYHWVATAFILAACAWLLLCAAGMLARVERETLHLPSPRHWRVTIFAWATDAILLVLMLQNGTDGPGQNLLQQAFAPIMLLGLRRLVPPLLPKRWSRWLEDRGLLALALAALGAAGVLGAGIDVTAVLLLAAGLYGASSRVAGPGKSGGFK
jgi:hypothetical protein